MIQFACGGCGKRFTLPPAAAGRKGICKSCGAELMVPNTAAPAIAKTPTAPAKLPMRTRRLIADARQMAHAFQNHDVILIRSTQGEPADLYEVEYQINGIEQAAGEKTTVRNSHVVQVQLTSDYPRLGPKCRILTPIFHPNIDSAGIICIGDHWTAGERLVDLVVRIGEMIAYQAYNIKSPLNGEAAMWADLNPNQLPTDTRSLQLSETT
jgi:ubiquitin-protein ligase